MNILIRLAMIVVPVGLLAWWGGWQLLEDLWELVKILSLIACVAIASVIIAFLIVGGITMIFLGNIDWITG